MMATRAWLTSDRSTRRRNLDDLLNWSCPLCCPQQGRVYTNHLKSDTRHNFAEALGIYPGLQGGFILATLPDRMTVAQLDHQVRAQVVSDAGDLSVLQGLWEAIRGDALPRTQSIELIKEAAKTWT